MDYQAHRLYVVDFNNHAVRIVHLSEITGIENKDTDKEFSIYPNPAGNEILIRGGIDQSNLTILIYRATGQLVKEEHRYKGTPMVVNISDLEGGIYCIGFLSHKDFLGYRKIIVINK